jgi:flavin-binding protein dodecin
MSVARIVELSATSTKSFEDAIQQGVSRATKTLRNVTGAWIKEQQLKLDNGSVSEYQVNMLITFVLEDTMDQNTGMSSGGI